MPLVVVVTDGEATVPLRAGSDPTSDAMAEGLSLRRARIGCVVADTALEGRGCAAALAQASGGVRIPVSDLVPDAIVTALEAVR